jgi:hypothetical protein
MHASYACRDAGACCTAGWPIPIERAQAARVGAAIADGRVGLPVRWLSVAEDQPDEVAGVLGIGDDGCVFHRGHRCQIHAALGHDALPSCCQHFPRDYVIDDRGVFVTLSHYCPTAAGLLFTHGGPIEIVAGPPTAGTPPGLDARGTLPPLLTRGVLMDPAGLTAWEAHAVSWLGGARNPDGRRGPEQVLELLESHAGSIAAWRPGEASLAEAIAGLDGSLHAAFIAPRWEDERALRAAARASLIPPHRWPDDSTDLEWRWQSLRLGWRAYAPAINRFLAAHAFASWMPYQGGDVLSGVRRLRLALAVLRAEAVRVCDAPGGVLTEQALAEAIRQSDLLLVHLADRQRLATRLIAGRSVRD